MEKFRAGVFLFLLLVLAVLTFSLTKSWRLYDSGYEVTVESPEDKDKEKDKETVVEPTDIIDLEDGNGKVFWKQFYIYPVGLVTETGGYNPDGIISHARNLYSTNLKTGSVKKLFTRDVYVWDFFQGDFTKKIISNTIDVPKEDSLEIERKLIVFAATEDSNDDGVLNHKDYKRVYLFDPEKEVLVDVLPPKYQFRKLVFNTSKNNLALIVKKIPEKISEKSKGKKIEPIIKHEIYSFDVNTGKGLISSALE
ncbi:MAG: hypothetical protein SH817_17105 [Leptospira sp.]|nr:hypothetical protein [Leptospira sp.]